MKMQALHRVGVILVAVLCFSGVAFGQGRFTMEEVRKAWKGRQKRVQSGTFTIEEKRTIAKGSKGRLLRPRGEQDNNGLFPPQDLSYRVVHVLTFDGAKVRYTQEGKTWHPVEGKLADESYVTTFDGTIAKTYRPRGAQGVPRGTIAEATTISDTTAVSLSPFFIVYRSMESGMVLPFSVLDLEKTEETALINERNCTALRTKPRSGNAAIVDTLWVDPERDFLITRYTTSADGKVNFQIDFAYEADGRQAGELSGWRFVYYQSGGAFQESGDFRVTKRALNLPIDPDQFDLTFPEKTLVLDRSSGKPVAYVLKAGDNKRVITEADAGKSYEEVLNESDTKDNWGTTFAVVAMSVVIVGFAVWRLSRWKKATSKAA